LSSILLSRLTPYTGKIVGINSVEFDVIDLLFCICEILEKKWEYSGTILHSYILTFGKPVTPE
jgi:hypothetical protein